MRRLCTLFLLLLLAIDVLQYKRKKKQGEEGEKTFMLLCGAVISQMKDFFVWCCSTQIRWMMAEDCL
jgi:hypothetical protein